MKKIYQNSIVAIGLLSLLTSCKQKQAESTFTDAVIPVKISAIQSYQVPAEISATGLIATEAEANYAFKIGGVISKIYVQEGATFKKGQLLATLNPIEISSNLAQAHLAVEKAKRDYDRASNLYKDSVSTLEQLQNAKTGLDLAKKSEETVAFNAEYAKIYALSDGFITKKIANEGEVIAAGMPVLATNENSASANWTLKLGLTDKEWAAIKIGQSAEVKIDAFQGKTFDATVLRKSQAADQSSGSFQVELKLELKGAKPALGMFAKAKIKTGANQALATIPYEALVEADGNTAYIYIPSNQNHVKRIPIIIERFDNQLAYVKSGLERVSNIIVSNSAFLNEKSIVKIIN